MWAGKRGLSQVLLQGNKKVIAALCGYYVCYVCVCYVVV